MSNYNEISSFIWSGVEEERELLSEVIEQINSVYGIELRDEDKYYLENVDKKMMENKEMNLHYPTFYS